VRYLGGRAEQVRGIIALIMMWYQWRLGVAGKATICAWIVCMARREKCV